MCHSLCLSRSWTGLWETRIAGFAKSTDLGATISRPSRPLSKAVAVFLDRGSTSPIAHGCRLANCRKSFRHSRTSVACTSGTSPVCLVHLVDLGYLVSLVQPNRRDRPDEPERRDRTDRTDQMNKIAGGLFQHPDGTCDRC